MAGAVRGHGARLLLTIDAPASAVPPSIADLTDLSERFVIAAWRAHAAGADGVVLTSADGGVLHHLISPLHNQRADIYGLTIGGRLRMPLEIIEGVRAWLGRRIIVAFRLLAEEFMPGGMSLQDARVVAKRVTAAGVRLLDVTVGDGDTATLARFPGWAVPLANGIKRVIPDVPVIGSGLLGDPLLADSIIRDGSVDLVMLREALRADPDWPLHARDALDAEEP
jgi:2,4-dienoyl-CoA reductase-like NADH-dependent reductase (Old Yellow Enzyme family)